MKTTMMIEVISPPALTIDIVSRRSVTLRVDEVVGLKGVQTSEYSLPDVEFDV